MVSQGKAGATCRKLGIPCSARLRAILAVYPITLRTGRSMRASAGVQETTLR